MKIITLLTINETLLKLLHENDINIQDCKYIGMYNDFNLMRLCKKEKYDFVISTLSKKYSISASKVKRLLKKYNREIEE